nr:hypothetical protein [Tanacetum cinerariifolium]
MVNSCLKKKKFHLASFDMVVKERTTATIEGTWGFKHTKAFFRDDIIPFVKALKELFTSFDQCLIDEVSEVQNVFKQMELAVEQHFNNQLTKEIFQRNTLSSPESVPTFAELFEINDLKAQAQAKDTVILKLKEKLHSLNGDVNERNVKREVEEIETLNIELDHKVTKLVPKNEHLNQTYKQLLQEKVLVITALKEQLNKLKGKAVITEAVSLNLIDPELLKVDVAPLAPKLRKNRTAHSDYIRHTQEEAATLREIVEIERLLSPLNTSLDYALENVCPLTRIATPTIVPPKEPIPIVNSIDKPVVTLVYSRKTKAVNKKVLVSNSRITKSLVANKMEPNNSWGSSSSNVPSPLIACSFPNRPLVLGLRTRAQSIYVGQFCDSDLEVAFRQHTCFIHNLDGVDLLTGIQDQVLALASSLITLNFGVINHLARQGLVIGLSKLQFEKDHLCSACAMGKSTKKTHKPKSKDTNQEKLYLLHMDLCGTICVESVNGKKYILIIVDDYSRFTWVKLLRSKDETSKFIIKFLKMIQNGVVERRNRTLIKVACTMLIYAQAPLFLWAEAVATTCFTQNRSIIRLRHGKTPYELLHSKLLDLSFFHVFGALCYPTNNSENLGMLQPKADIKIFIGYAPTKKAFRIYNRRTRRIVETIHVDFDELTAMASEQSSSRPALNEMTPGTISSGLMQKSSPSISYVPPLRNDWDLLFQPMFNELLNPPPSVVNQAPTVITPIDEVIPPVHADSTGSPSSTTVDQDAPSTSKSHTPTEIKSSVIPQDVGDDNLDMEVAHMVNDPLFGVPIPEVTFA